MPSSLEEIQNNAFSNTALTSVSIPEGVTLYSDAFLDIAKLESVTLPAHFTPKASPDSDSMNPFRLCTNLTDVYFGGTEEEWFHCSYDQLISNSAVFHFAGQSGMCGQNLSWNLSRDGVLSITGMGVMYEYTNAAATPWHSAADSITIYFRFMIILSISNITSLPLYFEAFSL